jgi:predicted nucleic acid-binding protein
VNVTEKVPRALSSDVATGIVSDLSAWQVHRLSVEDIPQGLRVQRRCQTPFEDAMIVVSVIQLGCVALWSQDVDPGQVYDRVRVATPF